MSKPLPPNNQDELSKLWFRKPIRQHVKEFSCVLAIIGFVITASQVWHKHYDYAFAAFSVGIISIFLGYLYPRAMLPVWRSFMRVGEAMGHVVTFVVLFVMWTLVLIPTALGLKVFGKSVMSTSFDRSAKTYWENRDPSEDDFKLLERQF